MFSINTDRASEAMVQKNSINEIRIFYIQARCGSRTSMFGAGKKLGKVQFRRRKTKVFEAIIVSQRDINTFRLRL